MTIADKQIVLGELWTEPGIKKYVVLTDMARALGGKGFLMAMAGMVLMIVIASLTSILAQFGHTGGLANGYHAQLILNALSSDDVTLALPILCTLPFTAAFVDDMKSGYIKLYLPRSGTGDYIRGKLIACGVSGGLALAAGVFIAYGLSALICIPMELAPDPKAAAVYYFAQVFTKALTIFLSGAFWSLTGFAFAAMTMSKYMAYTSPFILYYVLIILHERYFPDFYVLYPKEWLAQTQIWVLGWYGVAILLMVLSALMCFLFAITAKRRLENV